MSKLQKIIADYSSLRKFFFSFYLYPSLTEILPILQMISKGGWQCLVWPIYLLFLSSLCSVLYCIGNWFQLSMAELMIFAYSQKLLPPKSRMTSIETRIETLPSIKLNKCCSLQNFCWKLMPCMPTHWNIFFAVIYTIIHKQTMYRVTR